MTVYNLHRPYELRVRAGARATAEASCPKDGEYRRETFSEFVNGTIFMQLTNIIRKRR